MDEFLKVTFLYKMEKFNCSHWRHWWRLRYGGWEQMETTVGFQLCYLPLSSCLQPLSLLCPTPISCRKARKSEISRHLNTLSIRQTVSAPILSTFQLVKKKKASLCTLNSTFLLRILHNWLSLWLCWMPALLLSMNPYHHHLDILQFLLCPRPSHACFFFFLSQSNCLNVLSPFLTSYSRDIEL